MTIHQWVRTWFEEDGGPRYVSMNHSEWFAHMLWSLTHDVEGVAR